MVAEYAILRVQYFTSLRHSSANWFRRSDNTDVIHLQSMRNITLHPARVNEWRNCWLRWPRSKQALASVLLWASRADATRITFDPNRDSPLVYSNASLDCIETEVPAPPDQVAQTLLQYLRDIATGDRFFGMLRSGAKFDGDSVTVVINCLLYTSPSPRDRG